MKMILIFLIFITGCQNYKDSLVKSYKQGYVKRTITSNPNPKSKIDMMLEKVNKDLKKVEKDKQVRKKKWVEKREGYASNIYAREYRVDLCNDFAKTIVDYNEKIQYLLGYQRVLLDLKMSNKNAK